MGTMANKNAVITVTCFTFSCLSCTGVSWNNWLPNKKFNVEVQLPCWVHCLNIVCSAFCFVVLVSQHQSNCISHRSIVYLTLSLCDDLSSVCWKHDQFLWLHLINFRYSKFGTMHCLFCADINHVCLLPVRCGFCERTPLQTCQLQFNCLQLRRWRTISY